MRVRVLLLLSIGLCAADAVSAYLLNGSAWVPAGISAVLLALCFLLPRKKRWVLGIKYIFLGLTAGFLWYTLFCGSFLAPVNRADGTKELRTVAITESPRATRYGYTARGLITLEEKAYPVLVYLDKDRVLEIGDRIRGRFLLESTTGLTGKSATYHRGQGVFLLAWQESEIKHLVEKDSSRETKAALFRERICGLLDSSLPEDVRGFARALLLGDSSRLDYGTDTAFRITGIRHVIAVSGLHVSMLYGLIQNLTLKKPWLTAIFGIPALALFCAVAGFTPSVIRSCVMMGVLMLSRLINRDYDSFTGLSLACLLILGGNPFTVTSAGFQLSVLCVAGIVLFSSRLSWYLRTRIRVWGWKYWAFRWLCTGISVTAGATALTAPLSAVYFGSFSLISPLTNLLILWAVTGVFLGLTVLCLLAWVWLPAGVFFGKLLAWPIRYVLWTAKLLSRLPFASVYTCSEYVVLWLVFCYILLGICLIRREKKPLAPVLCSLGILCLCLLCSNLETGADGTRMTVVDVGQGQSVLLENSGRTFLVDCGGSVETAAADAVAEELAMRGIRRLDGIVLTHLDADHAYGIDELLSRVETDRLWYPAGDRRPQTGREATAVDLGTMISFGSGKMTVYGGKNGKDSNEKSLCVLFAGENCAILITGDRSETGERELLSAYDLPPVDVLIAGHHGAKDSTSESTLETLCPKTVMISVGEDNGFGHPARETLSRLERFNCRIFRTDKDGTLYFRR